MPWHDLFLVAYIGLLVGIYCFGRLRPERQLIASPLFVALAILGVGVFAVSEWQYLILSWQYLNK